MGEDPHGCLEAVGLAPSDWSARLCCHRGFLFGCALNGIVSAQLFLVAAFSAVVAACPNEVLADYVFRIGCDAEGYVESGREVQGAYPWYG